MKKLSRSKPNLSAYGIAVLNGDGTIRYCNELLLRWIDATPRQCKGKSITMILPDFPSVMTVEPMAVIDAPKWLQLQPFSGDLESVKIMVRPLELDGEASLIVVVEHGNSIVEPVRHRDMNRLRAAAE